MADADVASPAATGLGSPSRSIPAPWRAGLAAAIAVTLTRGQLWLLALASFLVRGGIVVLLPPVLILPTPARLASFVPPTLVGNGLSDPAPGLITLAAITSAAVFVLLIATTIVGAWLDLAVIEATVADDALDRLPSGPAGDRMGPGRTSLEAAIEARFAAHLPTAIAIVIAIFALRDATMAELTSPSGTGSLLLRIVARAPLAAAAVITTWYLGEAWGGLAVRRLSTRRSVLAALGSALRDLLRPATIATSVAGTVAVVIAFAALWLSSGRAFERLWPILTDGGPDAIVVIGLTLLVASWAAGLWLLAIGLAFRSIAWTAEAVRRP